MDFRQPLRVGGDRIKPVAERPLGTLNPLIWIKMAVRYYLGDDGVLRRDRLDPRRIALELVDDVVFLTELDSLRGNLLQ
jgi:hypothetical protein